MKIQSYPVPLEAFDKEEAPYIYTEYGEALAKARPHLEPRTVGTIACFGGEPLKPGITARSWLEFGYVTERK